MKTKSDSGVAAMLAIAIVDRPSAEVFLRALHAEGLDPITAYRHALSREKALGLIASRARLDNVRAAGREGRLDSPPLPPASLPLRPCS